MDGAPWSFRAWMPEPYYPDLNHNFATFKAYDLPMPLLLHLQSGDNNRANLKCLELC